MPDEPARRLLDLDRVPLYELLFRMGKGTMRPGGAELTRHMLAGLNVTPRDEIIEFGPGMGATTRMALESEPASYTAVERDAVAQRSVEKLLQAPNQRCIVGTAEATGLEDACASVVFGEAMLTMQINETKVRIVAEARRLLREGGRYGIHETCLTPDDMDENLKSEIEIALRKVLHVGARPLTFPEWRTLLEENGFSIQDHRVAPLHLLEPRRLLQDEGPWRAFRFVSRVAVTPAARRRVLAARKTFMKYREQLSAVTIIAIKEG